MEAHPLALDPERDGVYGLDYYRISAANHRLSLQYAFNINSKLIANLLHRQA